ncbi:hypothetical protein [Thermococcus sp. GR6]|uniref:hypothetical protein n=1 Tax=Thermococcus sp. GR6 TaxID=1638256 RepID=UPI0014310D17|nr:hypothetical protein [Thermococcus sp. GR6]NJE43457.1 hypothetical protein [Thermococcus sp. GR6]
MYSLYYDWLQGKPAGLATFNVEPILNGKPFTGELILAIIDYNTNPPKIVKVERIRGSTSASLKIQRIPIGTKEMVELINGKLTTVKRTTFMERKYFISIVGIQGDKMYSGGKFIVFEPKNPLTQINLRIKLNTKVLSNRDIEKLKNSANKAFSKLSNGKIKESDGILYSIESLSSDTDTALLPAGVIHAAPGTKVEWHISSGAELPGPTGLWYDSFYQYVIWDEPDPNGWEKGDKSIAIANTDDHITLDNTYSSFYRQRKVFAHVQYRIDTYMIGSSWWVVTEYVITPQYILDLEGGSITTDYSVPLTPPSYAGTIHNSPQWINFETNEDGPGWMVQSVTFTFGIDYEAITADVTVTLYRAAGSTTAKPPYVRVYNAIGAKYWYKDNDRTTYEVYFHW